MKISLYCFDQWIIETPISQSSEKIFVNISCHFLSEFFLKLRENLRNYNNERELIETWSNLGKNLLCPNSEHLEKILPSWFPCLGVLRSLISNNILNRKKYFRLFEKYTVSGWNLLIFKLNKLELEKDNIIAEIK